MGAGVSGGMCEAPPHEDQAGMQEEGYRLRVGASAEILTGRSMRRQWVGTGRWLRIGENSVCGVRPSCECCTT